MNKQSEEQAVRKRTRRGVFALFAVIVMMAVICCAASCKKKESDGEKTPTTGTKTDYMEANKKVTGLKLYYNMQKGEKVTDITDASGNGNDGKIINFQGSKLENNELYIGDGAYVKIPESVFIGEDTLTISIWLKNYSGASDVSAMFFGTKQTPPLSYWLLNPANTGRKVKCVYTDGDDKASPFNTEVGVGSKNGKGITGPMTDMNWHHYVSIITEKEFTIYFDGKKLGSSPITKKVSDFGEKLVAFLGKSSYDDPPFRGFIKELKVYDTVLSEEEIQKEYEANKEKKVVTAAKSEVFIADRADPYVTKGDDGYYYFTASYPMRGGNDREGYDRIILRRAKTIEELKSAEEITVWDEKTSNISYRFIWAPELHKINGKWYIFYAASSDAQNVWDIGCHVMMCESDDPYTGKWVEKGKFQAVEADKVSFTKFSLDMTYFENNGKHYVIWAQSVGNSNLYMAQINPDEPWKTITDAMLLTKPEYYWEKVSIPVNEGPAVLKHGGKVFVAYSASATGPEYCIGLMYADENADLLDQASWKKLEEPLLTSGDLIEEYGPGHNSFTKDENGNDIFVYHSRGQECYEGKCGFAGQDPLVDPCRSARVRKVVWDDKGFPILNQ